jgi:hypothetical protein
VESAPRAYRLKASNAAPPISTFAGAIPPAAAQALKVDGLAPVSLIVETDEQNKSPAQLATQSPLKVSEPAQTAE